MAMVICNKAKTCRLHKEDVGRGFGCGGAVPHDSQWCEPCHAYPDAECVPVEESEENT